SVLFFKLVQLTSAVFASTVSYLIPLVAIFWGLFDGEVIGLLHLLGMALILLGVYLSRKQ
ncbi:MAG: EamA family transporter, partial [Bacteroidota bacterium]